MAKRAEKTAGRGGRRPGSGRPTLYPGKSIGRVSVRLTPETLAALETLRVNLGGTTSDAVEYAIRKVTKLPTIVKT